MDLRIDLNRLLLEQFLDWASLAALVIIVVFVAVRCGWVRWQ